MIALGCDHGGYELMQEVKKHLEERDLEYKDYGCNGPESVDYPVYGKKVAEAIVNGECEKGILICGTGIGISITANKFKGIRAALCTDCFTAEATRLHNDANILAMGGRVVGPGLALKIVDTFLDTPFSGDERHIRRINMIEIWKSMKVALLQALMLYLLHEAPPEEQNFAMIMEMLGSAQVKEEDEDYESPLDILFDRLEMRDPDSIAVKQYHIYKQAAGKTAKSILISVGVRLAAFNLPQIAKLTNTDELDLSSMGERKVALFCCIPDADTSLNYLVGMIYSQLFQTLYYMADRVHGGALPVPVNCIMDEFPNVSLPNEFEKILATCRSRSIYCSIIIQNMSQLKALFKDSWESLVGNCDEFLYLGGNEKETHKYVSELLGKETIDTNTYGQTKGKSGSYSTNFQQSGRELLQPDEVRMLDNQNALLFIRGERPILDAKYDLMKHPNIRYTEDGGAGPFNYAKAPLAHDDFTFDETRYDDYELLLDEDIIGELF